MALNRLDELIFADGADVLSPGNAIFPEASFPGTEEKVPGAEPQDRG
jgi:hypothetical protein